MKSRFDEKALHRDPQAFKITSFHTAKWALKRCCNLYAMGFKVSCSEIDSFDSIVFLQTISRFYKCIKSLYFISGLYNKTLTVVINSML
jgi:hypothetical protein